MLDIKSYIFIYTLMNSETAKIKIAGQLPLIKKSASDSKMIPTRYMM